MYVLKKISHLKRIGLVGGAKPGTGMNGGACPDWLVSDQKDDAERRAKIDYRRYRASYGGQRQPDIEWFVPVLSEQAA